MPETDSAMFLVGNILASPDEDFHDNRKDRTDSRTELFYFGDDKQI